MIIDRIELRHISMPLTSPFTTSFGQETERQVVLVEACCGEISGWGEAPVMSRPLYNEETVGTALHVLEEFLVPRVLGRQLDHPSQLAALARPIRRNLMAKAGLEAAAWDLHCCLHGSSLSRALGGTRDRIAVGVSIGIQDSVELLLEQVELYVSQGYRRVKVKIQPGWDLEPLAAVRQRFPDVPLMADANSAYTLEQMAAIQALDRLGLMMIEQPLAHDDIIDHAALQAQLQTPICLDESIHSHRDARQALDLGSCRIINIKMARVGGFTEALAIHDLCRSRGVDVWCGGMLETGIGRAHNIALASLAGFTLPGDTSGSDRYWERDIVEPPVTVDPEGYVAVPSGPGLGYAVDLEAVEAVTVRQISLPLG